MRSLLWALCALVLAPVPARAEVPRLVFVQNPAYAAEFAALNVTGYWGLWPVGRPLNTQMAQIAAANQTVIAEDCIYESSDCLSNYRVSHNANIKGYLTKDEPNAAVHGGGACMTIAAVQAEVAAIRLRDPNRPVGVNFSPQMANPDWIGAGSSCIDKYRQYLDLAHTTYDFTAFDQYVAQQPKPGGIGGGDTYLFRGNQTQVMWGVNQLRVRTGYSKPVYFPAQGVSTVCGTPQANQPTWAEMRNQVFAGFVAGGKGPLWFLHCVENGVNERATLDNPSQKARMKAVNDEIASLDVALNAPDMDKGFAQTISVTRGADVRCIYRVGASGRFMAICTNLNAVAAPTTLTFKLAGALPLHVMREGRLIQPGAGNFYTDTFNEGATHVYVQCYPQDPCATAMPPAFVDPGQAPPQPDLDIPAAFAKSTDDTAQGGAQGPGFTIGWYYQWRNRGALRFPLSSAQLAACNPQAAELQVTVLWPFGNNPVTDRDYRVGPFNGALANDPQAYSDATRFPVSSVPPSQAYATTPITFGATSGQKSIPLGGTFLADLATRPGASSVVGLAMQGVIEGSGGTLWLAPHTDSANRPVLHLDCQ